MRIRKSLNIEKEEEAVFLSQIANALSHPVRIALFHYVKSKGNLRNDVCNKDLVEHFPYSQASISQHIKVLKDVGLLGVTYSNKYSIYTANTELLSKYIDTLNSI